MCYTFINNSAVCVLLCVVGFRATRLFSVVVPVSPNATPDRYAKSSHITDRLPLPPAAAAEHHPQHTARPKLLKRTAQSQRPPLPLAGRHRRRPTARARTRTRKRSEHQRTALDAVLARRREGVLPVLASGVEPSVPQARLVLAVAVGVARDMRL